MSTRSSVYASLLIAVLVAGVAAQTQPADLTVLDRDGAIVAAITDGDLVRLRAELREAAPAELELRFELEPATTVAGCRVPRGEASCASEPLRALGWFWAGRGEARPRRALRLVAPGGEVVARAELAVAPRPVVLVHGFNASSSAWKAYLGDEGFLRRLGLEGFAVGDLPAVGALELGAPSRPRAPTATLSENAEILRRHVAEVRRRSGAQMVDLVAHSMGGLVSRVYLARVMAERDVAQLIMLGTPHGGSPCARLPAALGFGVPAALELRPRYAREVLNPQTRERRGVPFATLAGTPIGDAFRSPCTGTPTDLVVSRSSAGAIGPVVEASLLHTAMTESEAAFVDFVAPLLQRPAGGFEPDPAESVPLSVDDAPQATQIFAGTLAPGEVRTFTVELDVVAVASFALYDPSRSLDTTVRGATGAVIDLEAGAHGLVTVDDSAALFQLGYGFENPRPGPWRVTLATTERTPARGAPFALSAQVVGGARLQASTSVLEPALGDEVEVRAAFDDAGSELEVESVRAVIRPPRGRILELDLAPDGGGYRGSWVPERRGLHGVDVVARARTPGGLVVERTVLLAIAVR